MRTVTSRDGTRIAFWQSGGGAPLLLVHGATADHTTTWRSVISELERRFTVYAMDRRGRGGSGDSVRYELQREAEDVAAVVDAIGRPVNVVGHSHGALCALEAALLTTNMRRVVLYEGVPLRGGHDVDSTIIDHMEAMLAEGDLEGVLVALLRDVARMQPGEIELMRAHRPAWDVRLENVRTIPRELRAYERYTFHSERFTSMRTPTLLLVGGESPPHERANATTIAGALPHGEVAILSGQQHVAMHTAPEPFVTEIARFLACPERTRP